MFSFFQLYILLFLSFTVFILDKMTDPNKKIEGDIDRFDDVFHQHGDDIDEKDDVNIDYDAFFTSFHKQDDSNMENIDYEEFFTDFDKKDNNDDTNIENIDYEQLFTDFYSNDENKNKAAAAAAAAAAEPNIPPQQIDPVKVDANVTIDLTSEEQHLSQKLSQLSSADKQQIDIQNKPKELMIVAKTTTKTEKKRPSLTPSTPVAAVITKKLKTDVVELSSSAGIGTGSGSGSNVDYMPKCLSSTNQSF